MQNAPNQLLNKRDLLVALAHQKIIRIEHHSPINERIQEGICVLRCQHFRIRPKQIGQIKLTKTNRPERIDQNRSTGTKRRGSKRPAVWGDLANGGAHN